MFPFTQTSETATSQRVCKFASINFLQPEGIPSNLQYLSNVMLIKGNRRRRLKHTRGCGAVGLWKKKRWDEVQITQVFPCFMPYISIRCYSQSGVPGAPWYSGTLAHRNTPEDCFSPFSRLLPNKGLVHIDSRHFLTRAPTISSFAFWWISLINACCDPRARRPKDKTETGPLIYV